MRLFNARIGAALCLALALAFAAPAQTKRNRRPAAPAKATPRTEAQAKPAPSVAPTPKPSPSPTPEEAEEETKAESSADEADVVTEEMRDELEVERVETDLVTVPVIASDRHNRYVPDMRQEDFTVFENGIRHEISFFATTSAPFHVVLMIDTSASTQEKLGAIQRAAVAFVEQLQTGDRVKVISFDDKVRNLSDFTNDRAALGAAIHRTRPGKGTKLYDAMAFALASLRRVRERKAVVVFTDGVDWHSDHARYDDGLRELEESGVIVYPIRFDTREETERLAREQARGGARADLGTIFGGGDTSRTTTPTTFPGEDGPPITDTEINSGQRGAGGPPRGTTPSTVPGGQSPGGITIGGVPLPSINLPRRGEGTTTGRRTTVGDPSGRGRTTTSEPWPDEEDTTRGAEARFPGQRRGDTTTRDVNYDDDSISRMLGVAYKTADAYLEDLALKSGGALQRADTLASLPDAFARIASELRTQYSLGYYPLNRARDGRFRKIQVKTTRKGVVLRARPGYRTPK